MQEDTVLVTGACGQIGSELVQSLRKIYKHVIATDLKEPPADMKDLGEFMRLDVLYKNGLMDCVKRFNVKPRNGMAYQHERPSKHFRCLHRGRR